MAVAIGYALHCPPLVLFSLISVGFAPMLLGGAGGPLAVLFVAIFAAEIGKGCFQGNENRYFGDPACDDWCRRCALCVVGACTWSRCDEGRQPDHVGDRSAAVPDGHFSIGARRRRTDLTDLVGCNLRGAAADRTGRRRCCSGLLRADGWLCSHVL